MRAPLVNKQFQGHMVREVRSGPEPPFEVSKLLVVWVKHRVGKEAAKEKGR